EKGRTGHKYIFSSEFKTVDELMDIYEVVTGRSRPRLRLPAALMHGIAHVTALAMRCFAPDASQRFTPGAVRILRMQRRANIGKARAELGYQPTTIRQAIEEQYRFFVAQGWIRRPGPTATSGHAGRRADRDAGREDPTPVGARGTPLAGPRARVPSRPPRLPAARPGALR